MGRQVFTQPRKIEQDKEEPHLLHALGEITEYGARVLGVIFNDITEPKKIVTVYFDRKMKGKI